MSLQNQIKIWGFGWIPLNFEEPTTLGIECHWEHTRVVLYHIHSYHHGKLMIKGSFGEIIHYNSWFKSTLLPLIPNMVQAKVRGEGKYNLLFPNMLQSFRLKQFLTYHKTTLTWINIFININTNISKAILILIK